MTTNMVGCPSGNIWEWEKKQFTLNVDNCLQKKGKVKDHNSYLLQALFTQDCFKFQKHAPDFVYMFESIWGELFACNSYNIFHYIYGLVCRKYLF